ncbi:MAG: LysM domain-containing protein [Pseudomonadota bacterium]
MLVIASSLLVSVGCATVEPASDNASEAEQGDSAGIAAAARAVTATEGLDPQARFRLILQLLERGDSAQAGAELGAYLAQRPNSRIAKTLLSQINTDATEMFPTDSFPVQLASGESLSTLARDYLGDLYLFYGLAKYNNIVVPRSIRIGQVINIPATENALAYRAQEKVADVVVDVADTATQTAMPSADPQDQNGTSLPEVVEVAEIIETPDPVTMLLQAFSAASETGDYTDVVTITNDHSDAIESQDWELLRDAYLSSGDAIAALNPIQGSIQFASAASLAIARDQLPSAIEWLQKSVSLDPDNDSAQDALNGAKEGLTDRYHREASAAFRAQELEKAISLWDEVLALDPEHSNALVYRAQAQELQERLSNLKK